MRILLVEDDASIASFVRRGLSELGYSVELGGDSAAGELLATAGEFDVLVFDVRLPGRSGVELCRALRGRGVQTPILMLTALSATGDKVAGLEAGADDYLVKPFEFDELVARLRALGRRRGGNESAVLKYDDLEVDLAKRQVTRGGKKIRLTAKEFSLLEHFLRNSERVLTRTGIGQAVWGMDFEYGGNVIEVYVSTLRRKVDRGFPRALIHTVVGSGYILSRDDPNA